MVTRKPVPPSSLAPISATSTARPPYPTTPTEPPEEPVQRQGTSPAPELHESSEFDRIDVGQPRRDSDISSHGTWDSDDADRETLGDDLEVPEPLHIEHKADKVDEGGTGESEDTQLPAVLRPGPSAAAGAGRGGSLGLVKGEQENPPTRWQLESNNPYLRQDSPIGVDLKARTPPRPSPAHEDASSSQEQQPVELPATTLPTEGMAKLAVTDKRPAEALPSLQTAQGLPFPPQDRFDHTTSPTRSSGPQALPSSNPWRMNSVGDTTAGPAGPELRPPPNSTLSPWDPHGPEPPHLPNPVAGPAGPLIDLDQLPDNTIHPSSRPDAESTQSSIPRPEVSIPKSSHIPTARQKNEHYQIKHINWYDTSSMRQSPILIQNANGPCPLLALVNALVLSTPADLDTALVDTLRSREQVSLGLLLDAVFDELMSGRRGDTAHDLPDVTELYAFLLALHTGMNVNPRFVATKTTKSALSGQSMEMNHVDHDIGGFEPTNEMRLYGTFNIPLIHGWTCPKESSTYDAFERSAQSFEDAQNIQFAEVELEDKQKNMGLNPRELQSLQDIQTIKTFLGHWPTQLTDHGLECISRGLHSGQIAILFRNDHFSTLYKEPKYGALMTLITDAGYSSHDEIVWESLVDVNGAASEMFSGDFRVVSHGGEARLNQGSSAGGQDGWQTVPKNRPRKNRNHEVATSQGRPAQEGLERPPAPAERTPDLLMQSNEELVDPMQAQRMTSEQEDHDLALALQLQEEEEDQQRQVEERRRREQELSEAFLSNEERPPIPPRRGAGRDAVPARDPGRGRAAVNRPGESRDPEAPPSYEQSASDRPYRPAGSTAPTTQGNPLTAYDALRRQQNAYGPPDPGTTDSPGTGYPTGNTRRQSNAMRNRRRSSGLSNILSSPGIPAGSAGADPAYASRYNQPSSDDRCNLM